MLSPVERREAECPNRAEHYDGSDQPRGYIGWHEWAEEKGKTHVPRQCPGCCLWKIWEPRKGASPAKDVADRRYGL